MQPEEENMVLCKECNHSFDKEKARQKCANCFACTGCEIYYCPYCENLVEIRLPKPMKLNK
ncbi:MAG: hypothetical protein U0W24_03495 [Bacteroidales bacterium]